MTKILTFAFLCLCLGVATASDGRVFHADYVRDGDVSRSFGIKNFRRLGFHVENVRRRVKRGGDERWKKHVYGGSSRFVGSLGKKDTMIETKMLNRPEFTSGSEKRYKREVEEAGENVNTKPVSSQELAAVKNAMSAAEIAVKGHENRQQSDDSNTHSTPLENIVAEDNKPQIKNNDTDKTLFVQRQLPLNEADSLKTPDLGNEANMKKTVVDDSVKLYPVYRGAIHHYLRNRRHVHSSPQLEKDHIHSVGGVTSQIEQGRSRRPLKRLALPLLLALKLKTALLLPVLLGLVGLIALKGLWAGLTGLAISAALGLKALLAGSTKVLVQPPPPPPPPPPHIHHFPPHDVTEYWSRNDFSDYHPTHNTWT